MPQNKNAWKYTFVMRQIMVFLMKSIRFCELSKQLTGSIWMVIDTKTHKHHLWCREWMDNDP